MVKTATPVEIRELCADHDPEVMRGSIWRAVEVSGEDLSHTVQALNT